jgi:hypothetical protein
MVVYKHHDWPILNDLLEDIYLHDAVNISALDSLHVSIMFPICFIIAATLTEINESQGTVKQRKAPQCKKCKQPMKGHKKGQCSTRSATQPWKGNTQLVLPTKHNISGLKNHHAIPMMGPHKHSQVFYL